MTPEDYYRGRDSIIYTMRVEERRTLQAIADQFGIGRERVRQITAKAERLKAEEERRRAADQDTLGAMQLSIRLRNLLHNENYPESARVIDVFEGTSLAENDSDSQYGKENNQGIY
jgi:hypothetical protein